MLVTVDKYINLLSDSGDYTATLGVVDVLMRDASGRPLCFTGNRSAVFKIRHEGEVRMLKCYTVPKRNLRRIYGDRCLHDELFVPSGDSGFCVDVVLGDWVEGRTLRRAIAESVGDCAAMRRLSTAFDRFALGLLGGEWAHGDIKPDNIIVDAEGEMHAIDFDAMYRPDLDDIVNDEAGTAAFQHPSRTCELYDKSIDDYPVALISSALHALSLDAGLHHRFGTDDNLLFVPEECVGGRSRALEEVLKLLADVGDGVGYRIAAMLASPVAQLPELGELLRWKLAERVMPEGVPVLANRNGLWGYVSDGQFVIPPVYDSGFEFSEGVAAVRLGDCFSYISPCGEVVLRVGECEAVKPFAGGRALVIDKNGCFYAYRSGMPVYPPPCGSESNLSLVNGSISE